MHWEIKKHRYKNNNSMDSIVYDDVFYSEWLKN